MRILNTTVLLSPIIGGGTAERTFQMSKTFVRKGCECTIVTTNVGLNDDRINSLEKVQLLALRCLFRRFFVVAFSIKKIKRLVSNVDVIHMMGHWNMINVIVYFFAKTVAKPYVICPAGELTLFGRSIILKRLFNLLIGKIIIKDASGYIAVTHDEIPLFEAYGVKSDNIIVIPNGVNESDFLPRDSAPFVSRVGIKESPYILFMGRLNPIKGPDLLLKAFLKIATRFPNHHLVFAGPDGGMLEELNQIRVHSSVSGRIHFVGYVSGTDKVAAYRDAELLVIPSRHEAMSIVVLESGMLKTPVLITNQCGFNDVEEVSGGIVVQASVAGIEEGLCKALEDPIKLQNMGENLNRYVLKNFTWNMIGEQYLQFFNKIINENRATQLR